MKTQQWNKRMRRRPHDKLEIETATRRIELLGAANKDALCSPLRAPAVLQMTTLPALTSFLLCQDEQMQRKRGALEHERRTQIDYTYLRT